MVVELDTGRLELCDSLRAQVDGETLVVLVYGNSAACRELIGPDITDRQLRQADAAARRPLVAHE